MSVRKDNVRIRECESWEELDACVLLQREVFALPDLEISPRRHLIVTHHAGGFILGAFHEKELVGFVLSVPAFRGEERMFYSHMTAVKKEFQTLGIGAQLKWAQRRRALDEGVKFIKWTFQPVQARNAFFNLEKLGAIVKEYKENFYGTDYPAPRSEDRKNGLESDRLFALWNLEDEKVSALSKSEMFIEKGEIVKSIEIPGEWDELVSSDFEKAKSEQKRIHAEFSQAFSKGLVCRGFAREKEHPRYLLYKS
jgi:predicted GNAT superfamily acetyltransferase